MTGLITTIHIIVCILLVGIVLIQQGKGSEMGASFGGAGQNMFGPRGAATVLTKITYGCAATFILTSLILAYLSSRASRQSVFNSATPVAVMSPTPVASPSSNLGVSLQSNPVASPVATVVVSPTPVATIKAKAK